MKTIKYAIRFLTRSRAYTIINLLGLALCLACSIILLRYIHQETTVDSHLIQPETIALGIRDIDGNCHLATQKLLDSTYIGKDKMMEEIEFILLGEDMLKLNETPITAELLATDSSFFHFFRYEVLTGDNRLEAPEDALITEAFARRVFGKENPVGKSFTYNRYTATVRGVLKTPACKSSIRFDVLLNKKIQKRWSRMESGMIRLLPGVSLEEINRVSNIYRKSDYGELRHRFIPAKELYWDTTLNNSNGEQLNCGNRQHIMLLSAVCLLVLLTGVINFVNLYLVQMIKRSREFGIKKVFGVQGWTLFSQLWTENFLLVGASLFFAWFFIEITALPVAYLLGETFGYSWFDLKLSLLFWLLLPLLTTLYPFIKYHYLSPIKGIRAIGSTRDSVTIRLVFLFVQTTITFLLIILALYFGKHLHFMLNTDPGFRTENILVAKLAKERNYSNGPVSSDDWAKFKARVEEVKKWLDECPMIERWMMSDEAMGQGEFIHKVIGSNNEAISMTLLFTSADFLQFYEVEVVEGALPNQMDNREYQLVLNESAMKAFGYTRMEEAFMRSETQLWVTVNKGGEIERGGVNPIPAVAVVKDFYYGHITEGKKPMAFLLGNVGMSGPFQMVCTPGRETDLLNYLKETVQDIYGTDDFEYYWMTDKVAQLYERDRQVASIYISFALTAVFISCLGLLGISLFDIRQRYREIAIRKVNGAQRRDLYRLLSRKYAAVLVAAFIVAVPLSYYLIYIYTADFVVKAPVGIGIYLIAWVVVVIVSLGTLAWQIDRAARINPAEVMKSE